MLNNQVKRALKQCAKLNDWSPKTSRTIFVDYKINERAGWLAAINAAVEHGKIGVVRSGMDCDCCAYHDEQIVDAPRSIVAWCAEYDEHCDWLDGPETTRIVKPSQTEVGHQSRDLVLEAYEDGHPHCVHL